jgi:hypothetical protein
MSQLMDDIKILCTGNPNKDYTLASCVRAAFPNTTFIYKSNGFDLTTAHGLELFRKEISNHNVFFNCSYVAPEVQTTLVTIAHEVWQVGRIFNIGSLVEYRECDIEDQLYADSKKSLRNQAIKLCSDNFKITHMTIDGYKFQNDPTSIKMPMNSIIKTIQWILFNKEFSIPFIIIMGNNTRRRAGKLITEDSKLT